MNYPPKKFFFGKVKKKLRNTVIRLGFSLDKLLFSHQYYLDHPFCIDFHQWHIRNHQEIFEGNSERKIYSAFMWDNKEKQEISHTTADGCGKVQEVFIHRKETNAFLQRFRVDEFYSDLIRIVCPFGVLWKIHTFFLNALGKSNGHAMHARDS